MVEKKENKKAAGKAAAGKASEKAAETAEAAETAKASGEATKASGEAAKDSGEVAEKAAGASEKAAEKATGTAGKGVQKQTIAITVLATVLVCVAAFIGIGLGTGMIKFGGEANTNEANTTDTNTTATATPEASATPVATDDTGDGKLMKNPNKQVTANGTLVKAGALQFYLPKAFTLGKNSEGEQIYNLTDGDGWADARVYFEKSNKDARDYLLAKNPNLSISSDALVVSGWSWSTASAAKGGIRAWATNYGDYVYAVILTVKLDSNETNEAARMIPKTLWFEKIYK